MSSTAVPKPAAVRRTVTVESSPSTTTNSTVVSPSDSPTGSASSTSLSSLGSVDEFQNSQKKQPDFKLVNTYGEEFKIPDYSIKDIRDAIPKHCFERSAVTGFQYVFRDIACVVATFYLFNKFCTPENVPYYPLRASLWAMYTFIQGLFGTGLWVLAHECGHQAFSPSKTLNDSVGWVLHSALLVPYFSWKISHGKHHKATGNMERDMVFLPRTREEQVARKGSIAHDVGEFLEEAPLVTALRLVGHQLGGWIMYLTVNVTGHDNHEKQPEGKGRGKKNMDGSVNHFVPSSPLFERKDEHLILLSDLGLLITLSVCFMVGRAYGFSNLFTWYIAPYLWVNHWLVAATYLQHTDPTLPHYTGSSWTFTRGAAATIDREFGFIGRHLFHGIIETHVLHHYISTIPFYHADEATEAIKPIMGEHYRANVEGGAVGFIQSLWDSLRWCQWVEPTAGAEGEAAQVLFFRNANGLGVKPTKYSAELDAKKSNVTVTVNEVAA